MSLAKQFEIHYHQFINSDGKLTQSLPADFDFNNDDLIKCYRTMNLIRLFDTKAIALQRTGKMGTYAAVLGQEAIGTALGFVMKKEDVLCPAYREYAALYQRGVKLSEIYAYWGGDERGSDFANDKEDLPISVPIASQSLHAAGVAYAFKYRNQPRVAVTICGDGGTSQGDFYEAMNVSGAWDLPVLFVVNNNQWAISIPRSAQTRAQTLAQKAIAAGFDGVQVDGNDIIACLYYMKKSLEKARRGEGPTLIEAITYRLCDHTTVDDANRYRDKAELERAWKEEPILRLRKYLEYEGLWNEEKEQAMLQSCNEELEKTVQEYTERQPQPVSAIFDYMYETWPNNLKEQRDSLVEGTEHA